MSLSETAERTVEMLVLIDAKLIARSQQNIDPSIKAMLLKEAMALHMTNIICEARSGDKPAEKQQDTRMATQKQLDYIKDLGGDVSTVKTSLEASKYIEDLRK